MRNLHTRKTSNGSNFGWLIQQMSVNQKSGRQTFRARFVSGPLFVSPCPPECSFQSETKIEPDLRLQLCHVRKLAFPLNISFYLMQHTPLWRSKFRILRIKKTRTKIGTLRISHTSSKLHRDIPSGSFTKTDLKKIGAITDKVW